jgi:hypothetical protein
MRWQRIYITKDKGLLTNEMRGGKYLQGRRAKQVVPWQSIATWNAGIRVEPMLYCVKQCRSIIWGDLPGRPNFRGDPVDVLFARYGRLLMRRR